MHEYDFDEMARHFNAMRTAYLEYRRGGPQPSVEKKLQKYLALSDLFFRKFPNPFAEMDQDFIPPVTEHPSRSKFQGLDKKILQIKQLRTEIEKKIETLHYTGQHVEFRKRLEGYLDQCDKKIDDLEKEKDSIETSRLPA